ncbi:MULTISPECIES: GDYXXLXY domain-containing protein [Exiguobacterium]|uniref:GDYXXLXY domain-containing protein n=1 Tax=Exiguobacterium TaxID=33986 RepID=UPI001BE8DED2|nr:MULTISPECIES: GDYXXLXY domain-containing protein [Exiguobacterium]MCT4781752.1 GDYXXLXY domain-containing protein [Exiguobacterium himgiriensis]
MKRMTPWLLPIIQVLIAVGFVLLVYAVSWFGQTYTFKATTYEPYDPFFGDSIYLEYDTFRGRQDVESGTVYVTFKDGEDGYATVDRVNSRPFFGGIRANYFDRQVYVDDLSSYRVTDEEAEVIRGAKTFEVEVDIAPWGMVRAHDLRPIETE